jgi:hypothetical protein
VLSSQGVPAVLSCLSCHGCPVLSDVPLLWLSCHDEPEVEKMSELANSRLFSIGVSTYKQILRLHFDISGKPSRNFILIQTFFKNSGSVLVITENKTGILAYVESAPAEKLLSTAEKQDYLSNISGLPLLGFRCYISLLLFVSIGGAPIYLH